ncbi:MAG TPA: DUF1839 family protein [Methylibium sp.]|nr:DUF1839 family protein [Methylibium sp.]
MAPVRHPMVVAGLSPDSYVTSPLHAAERTWVEKNCYVDIWIALLQALELEPRAMLGFTLALDFEGDQWTFFKPPHDELRNLYGIDVQELNVWRPLLDHAIEHLAADKLLATEADAYWLPDTAGTDYRRQHVKTTIVLAEVDPAAETVGYFHNTGYYRADGEDFRRLFRLAPEDAALPLYAETIRLDRLQRRSPDALARQALALLGRHAAWRPADNPVRRFAARIGSELPVLQRQGLPVYHAWAFATIRQLGAAFELAALHLDWLAAQGHTGFDTPAAPFRQIAADAKTLILKAARAVNAGRPLDADALLGQMACAWDDGFQRLDLALAAAA